MLDFRRNSKVPNYLGSSGQRRLLVLVALAALVAILVFRSGDLRLVWRAWFEPPGGPDPVALRHAARAAPGERNDQVPPEERNALFPGVRADYLSAVEDDTVFRAAEGDAWFHLLALLERTDQRDLDKASVGRVGSLQLDQQAQSYRGRLVTIGGIVRSAKRVEARPNGFGIKQYYQLWLQPERLAPALVVVYALQLPEGFPLGGELDASCTTTGFFFKRWAYQSQGGIRTVPLILARTVDWQVPPAKPPEAPLGEQIVWSFVTALIVAVLIVAIFVARQRSAGEGRRTAAPQAAGVGSPKDPVVDDLDRVLSDESRRP